jgi:hypothetical protein
MVWQPIDTAPKDSSWIGLWIVHPGSDYSPKPFQRFSIGYWQPENTTPGFERPAQWEATWIGEPTHWMPLPGPPDEAASPAIARSSRLADPILTPPQLGSTS